MKHIPLFTLLALLVVSLLTGCGAPPINVLDDATAADYAEQVEPLIDDTLAGLAEADYDAYTQHFDETMLAASTQENFDDLLALLDEKVGDYQSHLMQQVFDQGDYRVVIYRATFTEDDEVIIRAVFWKDDLERGISGLWFDSAKLR